MYLMEYLIYHLRPYGRTIGKETRTKSEIVYNGKTDSPRNSVAVRRKIINLRPQQKVYYADKYKLPDPEPRKVLDTSHMFEYL